MIFILYHGRQEEGFHIILNHIQCAIVAQNIMQILRDEHKLWKHSNFPRLQLRQIIEKKRARRNLILWTSRQLNMPTLGTILFEMLVSMLRPLTTHMRKQIQSENEV